METIIRSKPPKKVLDDELKAYGKTPAQTLEDQDFLDMILPTSTSDRCDTAVFPGGLFYFFDAPEPLAEHFKEKLHSIFG